jgi:hypothetical protein
MDESFSPVIFLYGMALVLAVSKACTLFIWRALLKPRPPLRQMMIEAWRRRRTNKPILEDSPDRQRYPSDPHRTVPASEAPVTTDRLDPSATMNGASGLPDGSSRLARTAPAVNSIDSSSKGGHN